MVRSKFRLAEIHHTEGGNKRFIFYAVCDDGTPENQKFAKYTPNGKIEMMVSNPAVFDKFQIGGFYYFDATPA